LKNKRNCPICEDFTSNKIFLSRKIDDDKITNFSFSSRKEPEFMRYRLVRCNICDLVYADEPPSEKYLHSSYHEADYDSNAEANDAALTYYDYMKIIFESLPKKQKALEIGTGNGIFLEYLKKAGFDEVIGIEPSGAAIDKASPQIKKNIKQGIFNEKDYTLESFDLICCFMTMEHVHDPKVISDSAYRLLRPGGAFVTITHNYKSHINRILGSKSPIIDIEHMQIFSDESIVNLMKNSKYQKISNRKIYNKYSLSYWVRLLPLPKNIKNIIYKIINFSGAKKLKLKIGVGNQITSGFKI